MKSGMSLDTVKTLLKFVLSFTLQALTTAKRTENCKRKILLCQNYERMNRNLNSLGFCILKVKPQLTRSSTHNPVKQHRRAMEEVSKCAEENCAFHEIIQFSHHISLFDIPYVTIRKYTQTFFLCAVQVFITDHTMHCKLHICTKP